MFSDASSYRWAGVLNPSAVPLYASDYWPVEILSSDITVKEALALGNALSSFAATIKDLRVDVYVDSTALFHAWNSQSAKSHALSDALKSIFEALMSTNCILRLFHVPSANNNTIHVPSAFFASSTFLLPTTIQYTFLLPTTI